MMLLETMEKLKKLAERRSKGLLTDDERDYVMMELLLEYGNALLAAAADGTLVTVAEEVER